LLDGQRFVKHLALALVHEPNRDEFRINENQPDLIEQAKREHGEAAE
jgi:hypothetical protein